MCACHRLYHSGNKDKDKRLYKHKHVGHTEIKLSGSEFVTKKTYTFGGEIFISVSVAYNYGKRSVLFYTLYTNRA